MNLDPDFDFNNTMVPKRKETVAKQKKVQENIKEYYKAEFENDGKDKLSEGIPSGAQRHTASVHKSDSKKIKVKKAPKNDYKNTKTNIDKIEPNSLKPRAQYKLREVCQANDFSLTMQDFEEEKVLIGDGKFGEVFLVYCTLNN